MPSLRVVLGTAALSLGLLALAAPAHAAPPALPDGDQLVASTCNNDFPDLTLLDVNPATGASTELASTEDGYCGYQGAWDRVTESFYFIAWDSSISVLLSYDPATGDVTQIGDVVDGATNPNPYALVIDLDGNAYFNWGTELYSIDLTSGEAADLGELAALDGFGYGFSVDPTTGALYLLQEDGELFLIDPLTVTATPVATWTFSATGNFTWGLAIDRAGTAWVVESPGVDDAYSALYSTPLATFGAAPEFSGNLLASEASYDGWWVALIPGDEPAPAPAPAPQLAATGIDATPMIAIAGMLGLAGLVLVASRRRAA